MEEPNETEVVKVPLAMVWQGPQLLPALDVLVHKTNFVTTHAYALLAWIFINEIQDNPTFNPAPYITCHFFDEVWLGLTMRKRYDNVKGVTLKRRILIDKYLAKYMAAANIKPVTFRSPKQVASYEARCMVTAYKNHVGMRFKGYFQFAINILLDTKDRAKALKEKMSGQSKTAIRKACEDEIWAPARQAKEEIEHRKPDIAGLGEDIAERLEPLRKVLDAYGPTYKFDFDDRFYDASKCPAHHVKALFQLALVLEEIGAKKHIQCFPLRTTWVPCHVHIDTQILCTEVLDVAYNDKKPFEIYWEQALELKGDVCRERRGKHFWGTIQTDGVSVSVIKKTEAAKLKAPKRGKAQPDKPAFEPRKRAREERPKPAPKRQKVNKKGGSGRGGDGPEQPARRRKHRGGRKRRGGKRRHRSHWSVKRNRDIGRVRYITELPRAELRAMAADSVWREDRRDRSKPQPRLEGRCVLIDPGQRDRLYAVHESSTAEKPVVFRHTRNQEARDRRTTHFRRIREQAKADFDKAYKGEWSVRAAEAELAEHDRRKLDPVKFREYVMARAQVWGVLSTFYGYWRTTGKASRDQLWLECPPRTPRKRKRKSKKTAASSQPAATDNAGPQAATNSQPSNSRRGSLVGQRAMRGQPLHRKLRLLAYIHTERANAQLVHRLWDKFGDNMVAIMGDWSAPHRRFQEPIRGKGMRKMLRRHGLTVYLLNEFKTSSFCPECHTGSLEKVPQSPQPAPMAEGQGGRVRNGRLPWPAPVHEQGPCGAQGQEGQPSEVSALLEQRHGCGTQLWSYSAQRPRNRRGSCTVQSRAACSELTQKVCIFWGRRPSSICKLHHHQPLLTLLPTLPTPANK
ncbi:hypothetical protein H4R19_004221 [Coemansia spiralis]|nr:hypothetical protein H4R19_004221 [Coemansia spiralis]